MRFFRLSASQALIGCMLVLLMLTGCATVSDKHTKSRPEQVSIGPYSDFSGRLIVIEPNRRWQVSLTWRATEPDLGWLRIAHAASGVVVELRWQQAKMQLRDQRNPLWRMVTINELAEQGIIIPPQELASILLGQMPARFVRRDESTWDSKTAAGIVRLQWQAQSQRLTMTDLKHGRRATLLIEQ